MPASLTGEAPHLGLIDIEVERNGFGSQLDSFACEASDPEGLARTRAAHLHPRPQDPQVGEGVEVLLRIDDFIAAAESPDVLVTVFHPELTACLAFHRYFARKCGLQPRVEEASLRSFLGQDELDAARTDRVI